MLPIARLAPALALLSAVGLAACAPAPRDGGRPTVVVGAYPMQYAAERVLGGEVDVLSIAQPGQEPHDLELGVDQVAEVLEADLVVHADGFQPALDELLAQNPDIPRADATTMTTSDPASIRSEDPHFWLDPLLMADLGSAVARAYGGAESSADRDDELRSDMERLDLQFERLASGSCERDTVVVAHDAFGYWDRFGLEFLPLVGRAPEAEPSVQDLADAEAAIDRLGITTVFAEPLGGEGPVSSLAKDTGTTLRTLDPIESQPEKGDYLSTMQSNLSALLAANGCSV